MNTIHKRYLLFLIGCIGSRLALVYIAKNITSTHLTYMGYAALVPAIGFIYIYLSGSRQTGAEVFGEKIWWNNLRPIHATLYFLFAYNAINGNRMAYQYLLLDVVFGLVAFFIFHYKNRDFEKVFFI
jgi:uncharacterized integral membrane protein